MNLRLQSRLNRQVNPKRWSSSSKVKVASTRCPTLLVPRGGVKGQETEGQKLCGRNEMIGRA